MTSRAAFVGGALSAAGLMYLWDPVSGRRRRHLAMEKLIHLQHVLERSATSTGRNLAHRGQGLVASAQASLRQEQPGDEVLEARVRSKLGLACSHPSAIEVRSWEGKITLSGDVLAEELDGVIAAVKRVRGVRNVRSELVPHAQPGNVPSLLGGRARNVRGPDAAMGKVMKGGLLGLATYLATRGGPATLLLGLGGAALAIATQRGLVGSERSTVEAAAQPRAATRRGGPRPD